MSLFDKPLFVFEMANNHQGDVDHGTNIITALNEVVEPYRDKFNFAVKLQYRRLETFIHKDYYGRSDIKNVKRFRDTSLDTGQYSSLRRKIEEHGFYTICTPFDEASVDLVVEHDFDVIKIASCSFTDWPLLEKIVQYDKPVIASTAGETLPNVLRVVNFFKNRKIDLSLMHCIAEYPTANENLQMNQLDLYQSMFPDLRIGFSTHESPDNVEPIKIAIAKGARIFEKHVGLPTDTDALNAYSASPSQVGDWLKAASDAYILCGVEGKRYISNPKEKEDLTALQRGAFAGRSLSPGEGLDRSDLYLAFPCKPGQLLASHLSKYNTLKLKQNQIAPDAPIMLSDVEITDNTGVIQSIATRVLDLIRNSGVILPIDSTCEISHHYGLDKFDEVGVTIINCINREYCKKILVVLPGQRNPRHTHMQKEETFTILYGDLTLTCNGQSQQLVKKGESKTVERGVPHSFYSDTGCVFEEISTTHINNDSYYGDEEANFSKPRKTEIYITRALIDKVEAI